MSRSQCPDCNASRGLAVYVKNTYCFSCHKKTPFRSLIKNYYTNKYEIVLDDIEKLPNRCRKVLSNYYLTELHESAYNISYSPKLDRILFYVCDSVWARAMDNTKKDKWLKIAGNTKHTLIPNQSWPDTVCIVEDIISGIRCADIMSTIVLCGTNYKTDEFKDLIQNYKNVILALDADEAGKSISEQFIKDYKLLKHIYQVRNNKDPKCYSLRELPVLIGSSKGIEQKEEIK